MSHVIPARPLFAMLVTSCLAGPNLRAGELAVQIKGGGGGGGVTLVAAIDRWDADGNPKKPVDPKAKIAAPETSVAARRVGDDRWVFPNLPPGRYDLLILAEGPTRIEGFHYPPVLEFDPFLPAQSPPEGQVPETVTGFIRKDIAKSRHYENKVTPLFFAGDAKQVRTLVQLLRDKPTSFDAEFGRPVATLRHEVWQYTNRFGTWSKEKKTRVLDRILMAKSELRRWAWVWDPALGGIEIGNKPVQLVYSLPRCRDPKLARGLVALEPTAP